MKYTVKIRVTSYDVTEIDTESTDINEIMNLAWDEYGVGNFREEWEEDETEIVAIYDDKDNEVWYIKEIPMVKFTLENAYDEICGALTDYEQGDYESGAHQGDGEYLYAAIVDISNRIAEKLN